MVARYLIKEMASNQENGISGIARGVRNPHHRTLKQTA
jgi:hypothetical protein